MTDPWGNPLPPDDLPPVDPQPDDFIPVFPPNAPAAPEPSANPAWPGARNAPPPPPAYPPPSGPPAPQAWPGHPAQPQAASYPGYSAWTGPKVSGMAIASLVCGLLSFLCFGVVLGPVAFGLGLSARKTIARSNGWRKGDGMAIAGIVLGIIGTVLAIITMIYMLRNPDALNNLFTTTTTSGSGIRGT